MKKFKFKLQALLDHRRNKEDKKKEELGNLSRTVQDVRDFMATLKSRCSVSIVELKTLQESGMNIEQITRYREFITALKDDTNKQMEKLSLLMKDVENRRKELVSLSKERKIMEKLRDKEFDKFKKAVLKEEKKLIDDLGISRFIRRQLQRIEE